MKERKPINLTPYIEANRKILRMDREKQPFSVALPPIDITLGKEIVIMSRARRIVKEIELGRR